MPNNSAPTEPIEPTKEQIETTEKLLLWMQETLGLDRTRRFADNDWMFIVKLHAMIETGLNSALLKEFNSPDLGEIISKLDTSNPTTGKAAFAKALAILCPTSITFLQKLSELRNRCVHDIRNFDFNLDKYLAGLTEDKRKGIVKPILRIVDEKWRKSIPLKEAIWVGVMQIMMELQIHDITCQGRELRAEIQQRQAELFQTQQESTP